MPMTAAFAVLLVLTLGWTVHARAQEKPAPLQLPCEPELSLNRGTRLLIESECEKRRKSAPKIVHGEIINGEVAPDEQHTAAIFYVGTDGKEYICTGVLIDATHLLTAGHCGCG